MKRYMISKEYMISLDFLTSTSVTALQLSELIGVEETALDSIPIRTGKDEIYWRFESTDENAAELSAGIEALISSIHPQHPINVDENIRAIYLSIGVLCGSYTCTVNLSLPFLAPLITMFPDLVIESVAYSSTVEDDEEEET